LGKARVDRLHASMDFDGTRTVDYRKFLRRLSKINILDIPRVGRFDLEEKIKVKMREEFDSAMQAFHAWDVDADGRLSENEFVAGVLKLEISDKCQVPCALWPYPCLSFASNPAAECRGLRFARLRAPALAPDHSAVISH